MSKREKLYLLCLILTSAAVSIPEDNLAQVGMLFLAGVYGLAFLLCPTKYKE